MRSNEDSIRMTFAKNVKGYRNALKYPQELLAEKAGLSVQTIKDIEACRRWVSDCTLSKLAEALNISEFQLFLPENYSKDKQNKKKSFASFVALRERLKSYMDEQFEKMLKSGDFS